MFARSPVKRGSSVRSPLLLQKRFAGFFWTQCSGAFNDNLFKNLLVLLVTFNAARYTDLSPALVANLAAGLFILPFVLFSAVAGQLADAMDKVRIMRAVKLAEIAIMLVASAGFYLHSLGILLAALFLMGVHSTVFGPVKYSLLPHVLRQQELLSGNAWVEMGTFVSILLGTLAAGYMTQHGDEPLYLSLAVVGTAIVGFAVSLRIPPMGGHTQWPAVSWHPGATRRLVVHLRAQRSVWHGIVAISWFWLMGSLLLAQLPAIVKDVLQRDAEEVTTLLAVFSVSVGAGSLLCERLMRGTVRLNGVVWAGLGISVGVLHLWWSDAQWAAADLFFVGVCSGLFVVPLYTLIQRDSPLEQTSRAIAVNNILNAVFMVGGALSAMVLLSVGMNALQLLACSAMLNVVFVLWWWRTRHA